MFGRILVALTCLGLLLCSATPIVSEAFKESDLPRNPLVEKIEKEIIQILANNELTWRERNKKIDEIYASAPPELLAQLPLVPEAEDLPKDVHKRINDIQTNRKIKLRERRGQIRHILDNITWEQRIAMQKQELPLEPPPGFEEVLGEEIYNQLLMILQNPLMSVDEKKNAIDKVMVSVPAEIVSQLPIPESFQKLPVEIQRNLRKLLYNFNLGWTERFRQLRQYIRTLPKAYRRILRSGAALTKIEELAKASGSSTKDVKLVVKMDPVVEQTTQQTPV